MWLPDRDFFQSPAWCGNCLVLGKYISRFWELTLRNGNEPGEKIDERNPQEEENRVFHQDLLSTLEWDRTRRDHSKWSVTELGMSLDD